MKAPAIRLLLMRASLLICTCIFSHAVFAQCVATTVANGTLFSNDNSIFDDYAFSAPGNAAAADNNRSIATSILTLLVGNSNYLKSTGFGFSIPVTASICGIVVEVKKSSANVSALAWVTDNSIRLLKGGSVTGSNLATSTQWPTTDAYYTYGGASNLWGTTWSPAEINAANFGVSFSAAIHGIAILFPSARIDHVRITVYYFAGLLPVKLTHFSAVAAAGHSAALSWTIANNDEQSLFRVQRSANGKDWTTIHSRDGEVSSQDKNYQYTDATCMDKMAWYRLEIVEPSGKTSFSPTIKTVWQQDAFSVYPNPARDQLWIEQATVPRSVHCIGIDGRYWPVPYTKTGNDLYKVDISTLIPGSYVIIADDKQKMFIKN